MFAEGTLVAGKFRIDRTLGRGGMGIVVAATHIHLHQKVAIKLLDPAHVGNAKVVERFVREARSAASLRGEHVCRVSDVGAMDDGTPYIVMELLDGTDLARLLKKQGAVPVQRACSYLLQACVGVGEAHSVGIVHRDLKPANLFLAHRPDGTPLVKVLDFGIAKAPAGTGIDDSGDFSLTQTTGVLGSPGYMSPEQLRSSRDVDLRTDIWSLGVILFELVSGRPPFTAESVTELAIRVWMDPRPPLVGSMPNGFDQVIDRCLAKKPEERYPDLANLAHALAAYAGPDGWDLANSVSRLLRSGPVFASGPNGPSTSSNVAPTMPPTSFPQVAQPVMVSSVPTTIGSSAVSMVTGPSLPPPAPARRWGLAALAGGLAIGLGVAAAIAVQGGGTKVEAKKALPSVSPESRPQTETQTVLPDAAQIVEQIVPIDAAAMTVPIDAEVAVSAPAPDAHVDTPAVVPSVKKKTVTKTTKTQPEDFGASRY